MRAPVARCFSASARNCIASSRKASPLNAKKFAAQKPYRTENSSNGSSGESPNRFRLLDQQACLLERRLRLLRGIAFDVHQSIGERDLKLDLLAAQRRRGGQGRDLVEGPRKLLCSFNQRRAIKRPLCRLTPQTSRPSRSARPRCSDALAVPAGSQRCPRIGFRGFRRYGREARVAALAAACRRRHPAPGHA